MADSTVVSGAFRSCRGAFWAAGLFSAGINLLQLAPVIYMIQVGDRVLSSGSMVTLGVLTLLLAVALLTTAILEEIRSIVLAKIGEHVDRLLAGRVLDAAIAATAEKPEYRNGGPLHDLDAIRGFASNTGARAFFDAPWIIIYIGAAFAIHVYVGALAVAGALVVTIISLARQIVQNKQIAGANLSSFRSMVAAMGLLRNAEVIHATGMQAAVIARWRARRDMALEQQGSVRVSEITLHTFNQFMRSFLSSIGLAVGAFLVIDGDLSYGAMFATMILFRLLLSPTDRLIGAWQGFVMARTAIARLEQLMTGEGERDRNSIVTTAAPLGRLTVEHVSYTRDARARPILRDITFAVQPGELLVVVGPSASGKTSLARLLLGVIKPSLGAVRLDGLDVYRWNRDDFGHHVGYLPQSVSLLPGTVRDNIARFREASNEDVIAAAEMVGIHETIARLPKAYDTELDETASQLSGGQRQLIGLARAVFGDPRLVVLDEPNSNLDSFGEAALVNAVQGLKAAGCTVVLITHKRALMDIADRVLALRDGGVQFFGTMEQARNASSGRPAGPGTLAPAAAKTAAP